MSRVFFNYIFARAYSFQSACSHAASVVAMQRQRVFIMSALESRLFEIANLHVISLLWQRDISLIQNISICGSFLLACQQVDSERESHISVIKRTQLCTFQTARLEQNWINLVLGT